MKALVIIIFVSLLFCLYWFICGFISTWHKLVIKQAKLELIDEIFAELEGQAIDDNIFFLLTKIDYEDIKKSIKSEIEKE